MYFVVINIPQRFRSIDLRNYFSEFIEKDAFNCFHYHHRPQYQLVDLIKCSAPAPPDSGAPGSDDRTTDVRCSEDGDTAEGTSQIGESSFSELPDTQAEKQNDGERTNPNTDSQGTTSLKTSSQETTDKESNSQETTSHETSSQGNTGKESDSEETTSLETSSQGNMAKESDSQETTSHETSSQENTGKESDSERTTNLKTNSQEKTGNGSDPQGTKSLETSFQGNTDKERDSQGTKSLETSSQGNTGKESDSQGTTSIETSSQGNKGKEGGSINSEAEVQRDRNASDDSSTHNRNSGVADLAPLKKTLKKEKKKEKKKERKKERKKEKFKGRIQWQNPAVRTCEEKVSKKSQSKIMQSEVLYNLMVEEVPGRTCCLLNVKEEHEKTFFKKYNHKHWVTLEGDILPQRCYLLRVDFRDPGQGKAQNGDNKTQQELSTRRRKRKPKCPQDPSEFQPGPTMPQGNVGTSTHRFHQLVRTCQATTKLLKRLGIEYSRNRKGNTTQCQRDTKTQVEGDIAFTAAGHLIPSSADFEEERKKRRIKDKGMLPEAPKMELEGKAENGPEMQKLQQHEPFHEDVTLQDRIKERHFEEALEMMWEEGLVFQTDIRCWWGHEQTPKWWPVDTDEDAGSLQQSVSKMNKEKGNGSSCGAKKGKKGNRKHPPPPLPVCEGGKKGKRFKKTAPPASGSTPPTTIGSFEAHTKGIGRRIMEALGWKEGQGLGKELAGRPYAIECNGQQLHGRKGIGFHGKQLQGGTSTTSTTTGKPQPSNAELSNHTQVSTTTGKPQPPLADFSQHTQTSGTMGKPQPLRANLSKSLNFTILHHAEDAQPSASTTQNT